MNPPTEQLIRDYLNRLSVAARSRLGVGERQALLDVTRARIEASVGGMSGATMLKVRRALADLGDPCALVEHEWARRAGAVSRVVQVPGPVPGGGAARAAMRVPAARRGGSSEPAAVVSVPLGEAVPGGGTAAAAIAASLAVGGDTAVTGRPDTRAGHLSDGSSASLTGVAQPVAVAAMPVPAGASAPGEVPGSGAAGPSSGSGTAGSSGSGSSSTGPAPAPAGPPSAAPIPPRPRRVPPDERIAGAGPGEDSDQPEHGDEPGSPGAAVAVPEARSVAVDEDQADDVIYEAELVYRPADMVRQARDVAGRGLAVTARVTARQGSRVGASLLALAMRDKLETLAILLLGLGGAVYPPVWVIGAILALISPKWDPRDKLLGLVLPVLLVVFGAVLVVALGGVRTTMTQYGLEGWLAAGRLARVGAVIGAGYLLRRVYRGRRGPKPPPWSRPPGRW